MHVNISVTVKTAGGISLWDGGKLEEPERIQLILSHLLCIRIGTDQFLCLIC